MMNLANVTVNFDKVVVHSLTPHCLNLYTGGGTMPFPSDGVARSTISTTPIGTINGTTVYCNTYGDVTGLPAEKEGHMYIVSLATANAAADRPDVLITNEAVRDDAGRVIGCRSWAQV